MKIFHLAASAALLLASTAAQAGSKNAVSFEIEGQKIRIEVPKHCDALSCIQISAPGLSKSGFSLKNLNLGKSDDDDDGVADAKSTPAPAAAPSAPQARASSAPAQPQAPAPATATPSEAPIVASTTPAPVVPDVNPGAPVPVSAMAPAAVTAPAPQSAPVATTAAVVSANTPIGTWRTEDDKGNVRIEQCGQNLCGYAVGSCEKILINMRPDESKWVGRIHDPDSGRNYDSTIAMKDANTLRVQGCAFGGLFCGGQTWKRAS